MEMSLASWSSLPYDLLRQIFTKLNNGLALHRSRRVCVSWQSVASAIISDHPPQMPFLLVLNREQESCSLSDIQTENNNEPEEIDLSIHNRRICNSMSNGWLLAVDLSPPYTVHLSNPISETEIILPPATTFSSFGRLRLHSFIIKGITTSIKEKDCIVLVIYGAERKLAFCRPGDVKWKDCDLADEVPFHDIMFYKGKFYAADKRGRIYGCDVCSDDLIKAVFIIDTPVYFNEGQKYLVETKLGDFVMICRKWKWVIDDEDYEDYDDGVSIYFEVYKMDLDVKEWEKIESLGGEAFFIGCNSSGVSYSDWGRRMSLIYYIHDVNGVAGVEEAVYGGKKSVSIYDMETGKNKFVRTSETWGSHFYWFKI